MMRRYNVSSESSRVNGSLAKKDRKRVTDRKAQQEHRKRQKSYVEELELQIEVLRRSSGSEQVDALLNENNRLRQKVRRCESLLSGFDSLIKRYNGIESEDDSESIQDCPSQNTSIPLGNTSSAPISSESQQNVRESNPSQLNPSSTSYLTGLSNHTIENATETSPSTRHLDTSDSRSSRSFSGQLNKKHLLKSKPHECVLSWTNYSHISASNSFNEKLNDPTYTLPQTFNDSVLEVPPMDGSCQQDQSNALINILPELFALQDTSIWPTETDMNAFDNISNPLNSNPKPVASEFDILASHCLSYTSTVQLRGGACIDRILERARSCITSEKIQIGSPVLSDLVCNKPTNILSSDIMQILHPLRCSRPASFYFGIYWLYYLVLHWQLTLTAESFKRMPSWLRPTTTQILVPHSIVIDTLVWPAMRDELINFAQIEPSGMNDAMLAFGAYSNFDYSPSIPLDATSERIFHAAVSDLRNWSMKKEFFDIYPQWEAIYKQSGGNLEANRFSSRT